jgi:NIPSNAP protein
VTSQLREYTVRPGETEQWLDEWRAKIVPMRRKFGFEVLGAWTVEESDQFIPDPARHLAHTAARLMQEASL